ncbi:hypothetical protein, partial [Paractinoplanes durhamensis]|uniref:hypothetical protein n=1 Tax=Paractinoplanes durhamensis TaxID=113563 RepID=UPI0031D86AE2
LGAAAAKGAASAAPVGAASVGAPSAAIAAGAAPVGSASVGTASSGAAAVGAASVGAASVGAASVAAPSVGAASVGAASVGAASVGAASVAAPVGTASVGAASVGVASAAVKVAGAGERSAVESRTAAQGVPPRGEVIGAKAAAAKAAGATPSLATRPATPDGNPETLSGLRGAGNEIRARMRAQRRLRVVTLVSLAIVVLVVLPAIFGLRSASKDPVFSSLDALDVPSWAATKVDDQGSGSSWCFLDCRFREREVDSTKSFQETTAAYTTALKAAGWAPWKVTECPETKIAADQGTYSCWKRDEFTLDLWVRLPDCMIDQVAAQDPTTITEAPATTAPAGKCEGSTVSIKVKNAIIDTRGEPKNEEKPLVGETPDRVVPTDPLLEPTPAAS